MRINGWRVLLNKELLIGVKKRYILKTNKKIRRYL
jgi:hypothetical protein